MKKIINASLPEPISLKKSEGEYADTPHLYTNGCYKGENVISFTMRTFMA